MNQRSRQGPELFAFSNLRGWRVSSKRPDLIDSLGRSFCDCVENVVGRKKGSRKIFQEA